MAVVNSATVGGRKRERERVCVRAPREPLDGVETGCDDADDWGFVTGVMRLEASTRTERKGKWAVFLPSWPEPAEGGLCTCTLGARRCSRIKGE